MILLFGLANSLLFFPWLTSIISFLLGHCYSSYSFIILCCGCCSSCPRLFGVCLFV